MADEEKEETHLEIAHVLFIDIVGYSKLLIDEQSESLQELNHVVRQTEAVLAAEAAGTLILLPTGDGMALVFKSTVDAPVECALQLGQAVRAKPSLPLRMGIHSGPVRHIVDVNGRTNVAGAGINLAQRVMDCGDAGHILISRRVADDLASYRKWQPYLHPLGDCEVKHGVVVSLVNLYAGVVGNPAAPTKLTCSQPANPAPARRSSPMLRRLAGICCPLILAALALSLFSHRRDRGEAQPHPAVAGGVPAKSVAVLPFENLSDDKANAFFTDGVQDEILTDLAKVADLKVIARSSVMQYKSTAPRNLREIAAQLGVANLLEGSVQRSGNQVRVNAQLINASTEAHVWAEHYDRPLDDVFAIQSEIAEAIAGQLAARLSPQEKMAIDVRPTADVQAFDLYLRAQALRADTADPIHSPDKLAQAARILNEALQRDPQFLLAWCLLTRVHCDIYFLGIEHTPARLDFAKAALQAALQVQPDAGETHLAQAFYFYKGFRDYDRARSELDLARRTLPNNAEVYEYTGYIDRRQGRWPEATRNLERALDLDPRNVFTLNQVSGTYGLLHRYADNARILQRVLALVPGDPSTRMALACLAVDARADVKPYQDTLAALVAEDPSLAADVDDPFYSLCERTPAAAARVLANTPADGIAINGTLYPHAYWEGLVARWEGDAPRAQAAFTAARAHVEKVVAAQPDLAIAVSLLGMIDAGLGRRDEAVAEGRRACQLLPVAKDSIDGAAIAMNLAQTLAWTGEKRAAVEQLTAVERGPNTLTYGLLKLQPQWDDLRGDAGFEALVASLAPP